MSTKGLRGRTFLLSVAMSTIALRHGASRQERGSRAAVTQALRRKGPRETPRPHLCRCRRECPPQRRKGIAHPASRKLCAFRLRKKGFIVFGVECVKLRKKVFLVFDWLSAAISRTFPGVPFCVRATGPCLNPDSAGTAGPQRRKDDHDFHPCPQPERQGRQKSRGRFAEEKGRCLLWKLYIPPRSLWNKI